MTLSPPGPEFLKNLPLPFILSDSTGKILFLNAAAKAQFASAANLTAILPKALTGLRKASSLTTDKTITQKKGAKTFRFYLSKDLKSKTISAVGCETAQQDTGNTLLTEKYEELKSIDRAKTDFLSISSHELRSPLTPMKAQLQMLQQGYFEPLNRRQTEAIQVVLRNLDRLDSIIKNLLEISRIEANRISLHVVDTDLQEELERLRKEMVHLMIDKHVNIFFTTEKLPIITVDPDRIIQILRILVHNAIKFSPNHGDVHITAEKKKNETVFSVQDSGIGLSAENQKKIFQPFFQAEKTMNRQYGGMGLGLSIAKGIVEVLGGKIWFESRQGKGTTFYFSIPPKPPKIVKPIRIGQMPQTQQNALPEG